MTYKISKHINESDKRSYRKSGYHVVRGYLTVSRIAEIESWILEIVNSADQFQDIEIYLENPRDPDSDIRRMECMCNRHKGFRQLSKELAHEAGALLGENAILFKDKINFKLPGGDGYAAHRDGMFWWTGSDGKDTPGWYAYARDFVTTALFLDNTTASNGCLEIAEGQHNTDGAALSFDAMTRETFDDFDFSPLQIDAGDLILFDARLPHRSGPNTTQLPRRGLFFTYNSLSEGDHRQRYYLDKQASVELRGKNNFYR